MTVTSSAEPARGRRTFAPRDWSLRVKLAVVLLVPGLLAAVLGGLRIADQVGVASGADRVNRYVAAQGSVTTLMERLQSERVAAAAFVSGGRRGDRTPLQQAFSATDAATGPSGSAVSALYRDDAALADAQRQLQQAVASLTDLRQLVVASTESTTATTARYTDLVDEVVRFHDTLLRGVDGTAVTGLVDALAGLAAARDETSLQLALVTGAQAGGGPAAAADAATLLGPLTGSDARLTADLQRFRAALDPARRDRLSALVGPHEAARSGAAQRLIGTTGAPQPAAIDAAVSADRAFLDDIDAAAAATRTDLKGAVDAQRSDAMTQVVVNLVVLALAIALSALVVGLVAREMLRSLRTLRSSALEVARERLPQAVARMREGGVPDVDVAPVPVRSQEEIGEVARAFDAVHLQAVRLAAEQATLQATVNSMFVNLSRRSQTLVDRQLQLIEELETGEQDADQLANLFRLDHLATRMRRNSENLLVLAGNDLAKRAPHRVPMVDVLRAAVSETEQYERITLGAPPDVAVAGRAANDLQHLIAELLDNATTFSSPGTPVVLSTAPDAAGALVVEIVDHGVGMPAAELAAANALLGQHTATSVTASRRMGLFVVARLATRHGIVVRLVGGAPPTGGGEPGLTARVTVPRNMVMTGPGRARPTGGERSPVAAAVGWSAPAGAGTEAPGRVERARAARDEEAAVPDERVRHRPDLAEPGHEDPVRAGHPAASAGDPAPTPHGAAPADAAPAGARTLAAVPSIPQPAAPSTARAAGVSTAQAATPPSAQAAPLAATPSGAPARAPNAAGGGPPAAAEPADPRPAFARTATPTPDPAQDSSDSLWTSVAPPPAGHPGDGPAARVAPPPAEPAGGVEDSGWFRSYRQVPITWSADPLTGEKPPAVAPRHAMSAAFSSPADEGWRAAAALTTAPPQLDEAGLPRRVPGARLVPGTPDAAAFGPPPIVRDADAVRERLRGYQQGMRQGRDGRIP